MKTALVIVGQHTDCCVRHTSYDAFLRGFEVVVAADATAVFQPLSEEAVEARQERALEYLRTFYGVRVVSSADLLGEAGATPTDPSRGQPLPSRGDPATEHDREQQPCTRHPTGDNHAHEPSPDQVAGWLGRGLPGSAFAGPDELRDREDLAPRTRSSTRTPAPGASRRSPAAAWSWKR